MMGVERKKIAFFSKGDDKFIEEIIGALSKRYEIKKVTIRTQEEMKRMDQWMHWADICWFEWCDGLMAYGSKLPVAQQKKIICRLHSYEAFTAFPFQVNWGNVDRLILVAEHVQKYVTEHFNIPEEKTLVIPNGVKMDKWLYKQRTPGYNVAYVGYINYKKGPMLLLHAFKALYNTDHRYRLYIAGQFQDPRYSLYFQQMVEEFGLQDNFFFEGWQDNLDQWLEDKNYILCTSVLESQNMSVMQAMAKGIKPVIHNFVGAKGIYQREYLWNTIDEAVHRMTEQHYDSRQYRAFIQEKYSFTSQIDAIGRVIEALLPATKKSEGFDYKSYWNRRLNAKFNIEGVGYWGLGEMYNQYLYKSRMDILEGVLHRFFESVRDAKVLELGPGTGIFTEYFYRRGVAAYQAIDITEKSVFELKNRYPDYCFKQGDVCDGRLYEGKYDLIFAADVLLHITDEEQYKKAVDNIAKHLEEHGLCILLDPISVIGAKSPSVHVVIRDRAYVEACLKQCGLELVEMLPVAFFMNYPFDKELLGGKGNVALDLFNTINQGFSNHEINDEAKQSLVEYLFYKEKQLLYQKNFGLSEKLLIIRKQGNPHWNGFSLQGLMDINAITQRFNSIKERLHQGPMVTVPFLRKIDEMIRQVENDDDFYINDTQKRMNEFIAYTPEDFDAYDFSTAQVMIGRREKTANSYEVVEFILNNAQNIKLIFHNIWYDTFHKTIILPEAMRKSRHVHAMIHLVEEIMRYDVKFHNHIAGFVFDGHLQEEIAKNRLAYLWERGIPASEFLPLPVYRKIIERYIFAAGFIDQSHKILEAPCGFGYGAAYFSKRCRHVEALDIAQDNIRFAKEAYRCKNVRWVQGDVMKLPYPAEEFDVYISYEVFEHLPVDAVAGYLAEAARVIKKTGKFILSTPNREVRKHVKNPFHVKEYGFHEFYDLIRSHFREVEFYSMSSDSVEKGMKDTAYDMIAVCTK